MILIGNGPFPFALGAPGQGNAASGILPRTAAVQATGAPPATIPAAATERSGQARDPVSSLSESTAIRAVLSTGRTEAVVTNPEDRYHQPAAGRGANSAEPLGYLSRPAPPLDNFVSIPMEVTAEIQRLREEIATLREELGRKDQQLEAVREGEGAAVDAGPDPGTDPAPGADAAPTAPTGPAAEAGPSPPPAEPRGIAADVQALRQSAAAGPKMVDAQR